MILSLKSCKHLASTLKTSWTIFINSLFGRKVKNNKTLRYLRIHLIGWWSHEEDCVLLPTCPRGTYDLGYSLCMNLTVCKHYVIIQVYNFIKSKPRCFLHHKYKTFTIYLTNAAAIFQKRNEIQFCYFILKTNVFNVSSENFIWLALSLFELSFRKEVKWNFLLTKKNDKKGFAYTQ